MVSVSAKTSRFDMQTGFMFMIYVMQTGYVISFTSKNLLRPFKTRGYMCALDVLGSKKKAQEILTNMTLILR